MTMNMYDDVERIGKRSIHEVFQNIVQVLALLKWGRKKSKRNLSE
jgi:hypothetical protein